MDAQAKFLDQFLWENRLLIIHQSGDNLHDKANQQERALLHEMDNLQDRRLKVFSYNGERIKQVYPASAEAFVKDIDLRFTDQYEMVLIGLDGRIKKRYTEVLKPKAIFDLIDSMPMRQSEIKTKF